MCASHATREPVEETGSRQTRRVQGGRQPRESAAGTAASVGAKRGGQRPLPPRCRRRAVLTAAGGSPAAVGQGGASKRSECRPTASKMCRFGRARRAGGWSTAPGERHADAGRGKPEEKRARQGQARRKRRGVLSVALGGHGSGLERCSSVHVPSRQVYGTSAGAPSPGIEDLAQGATRIQEVRGHAPAERVPPQRPPAEASSSTQSRSEARCNTSGEKRGASGAKRN